MKKLRYVFLLALGVAALTVPAALGAGTSASIKFSGRAQLQAPATVLVTVTYSCLPITGSASNGVGSIALAETSASGPPATGSVIFTALCDDRSHTETVAVPGGPYTPGTGSVAGNVCGLSCANNFGSPTEVTIR
jgi:hypothetical protein